MNKISIPIVKDSEIEIKKELEEENEIKVENEIKAENEIELRHKKYFKEVINNNLENLTEKLKKEPKKTWQKEIIDNIKENWSILAIGKPDKLKEFYENYIESYQENLNKDKDFRRELLNTFGYNKFIDISSYEKKLKKQNQNGYEITSTNFMKTYESKDEWNAYTFIFKINLKVCPYCNRQYITPILSQDGKLRADIDHWLPKDEYPYFSMSLYNLVPSCKFCNSSLKGSKYSDINPYIDDIDNLIQFKLHDELKETPIKVDIKNKKEEKKIKNYLNIYKIELLYDYHKDKAKYIKDLRIKYSEENIRQIYEKNKNVFKSIEEVKNDIIGEVVKKEDINNEPLSKLKRDILEQYGFIDKRRY